MYDIIVAGDGEMKLEDFLKKSELSSTEIMDMLYFINAERQDDQNKIDLYIKVIQEASKFGYGELYSVYKTIKNHNLTEEEKLLLQRTIDFYINEQEKNINAADNLSTNGR